MVNEEQVQEIEVLQSIYPDELTIISEEEYQIRIELESPTESHRAIINLHVKYPPAYPDVAPYLDIFLETQASSSETVSLSFPEDKDTILGSLEPIIEENIGIAMVFTLISSIKEKAESLLASRREALEKKREEEIRIEEEKEMLKFRGTPVTKETFMEWRGKFREEMDQLKKRKKEKEEEERSKKGAFAASQAAAAMAKRLTGKQLYLTGMVHGDEDEDVEGGEGLDLSKLKIHDKN